MQPRPLQVVLGAVTAHSLRVVCLPDAHSRSLFCAETKVCNYCNSNSQEANDQGTRTVQAHGVAAEAVKAYQVLQGPLSARLTPPG